MCKVFKPSDSMWHFLHVLRAVKDVKFLVYRPTPNQIVGAISLQN